MTRILTEEETQKCIELYENGLNCREISEYLNEKLEKKSVWALLKRHKIKTRSSQESIKLNRYTCDDHYFDSIDTEDKAYIFGFLYADGCNHLKNHTITIQISTQDLHILEYMTSVIQPNRPLGFHVTKSGSSTCIMRIYSPHMSDLLNSYGMVPRKTWCKKFPSIIYDSNEDIQRHFIRGYFDGNGSIYGKLPNNSMLDFGSTNDMLETIILLLKRYTFIEKYTIQKKQINTPNTTSYSLRFYRKNDVLRICNWMYRDSTIHLNRKYEKYLKLTPRKDTSTI